MSLWLLIQKWLMKYFGQLNGLNLLLTVFGYTFLCWVLLSLAGERDLTHPLSSFIYYLFVTASTVGYGDLSPTTEMGKWIVSLLVIPGGLGLFALAVGQIARAFVMYWKRGLLGKRSVTLENHILILGWNEQRTLDLIKMLLHEEQDKRPILLCVRPEIENPLPGDIEFVRVHSFTDEVTMSRTSIDKASCIIIDNPEDDISLSAALFCNNQNPDAHILAYFVDESLSELLKQHCPNVECVPSVSVEMIAKAAIDPGSSALHHELLSTHKGMTQYAVIYPKNQQDTNVQALFTHIKQQHDATLIAIDSGEGIELNPPMHRAIESGYTLYYIADERIDTFQWP